MPGSPVIVSLEPGAAGAEPAGLQSGQLVAAAGTAPTNRELVADEFAATAGEDRRAAGETCALLLAFPGGRTSAPAAVRSDARGDRTAAHADGIIDGSQVPHRNRYSGLE